MHHLACNYSTTTIFSGSVTGCCIPKIINSSHLQSCEKRTQNQNALLSVYALKVTAHQIVAVSWPVCLAFITFCFQLLLTESLKILTVSDKTVLYEILESQVIIFFLLLSIRCFSPILLKYVSGRLSIRAFLRFTSSDLLSVSTYTGF